MVVFVGVLMNGVEEWGCRRIVLMNIREQGMVGGSGVDEWEFL